MATDPFVALEGAPNFRDVGGVRVGAGGHIRRGILYRSGRLSRLSDADHGVLATLGIRRIYDLREPGERQRSPTRWPGPSIRVWTDRDHLTGWSTAILDYPQDAAGMRSFLTDLYSELPHAFAPRIGDIVRDLAGGERACVVHCAAGKDRTGVVVGVLLALAGASQADITVEYLRTAGRLGVAADQQRAFVGDPDKAARSSEAQQALWATDSAFLDAAFASIAARHGSLERYAEDALGLSAVDLAVFRRQLVGP